MFLICVILDLGVHELKIPHVKLFINFNQCQKYKIKIYIINIIKKNTENHVFNFKVDIYASKMNLFELKAISE